MHYIDSRTKSGVTTSAIFLKKLKNSKKSVDKPRKAWYIDDVDHGCRGEQSKKTKEAAIKEADYLWLRNMSECDKKRREEFVVLYGDVDEDGCLVRDSSVDVKVYKREQG